MLTFGFTFAGVLLLVVSGTSGSHAAPLILLQMDGFHKPWSHFLVAKIDGQLHIFVGLDGLKPPTKQLLNYLSGKQYTV